MTDLLERLIDGDPLVAPGVRALGLVPVGTDSPYVTLWIPGPGGNR